MRVRARPKSVMEFFNSSTSNFHDSLFSKTAVEDAEVVQLVKKLQSPNKSISARQKSPNISITYKRAPSVSLNKIARSKSDRSKKTRPPPSFFVTAAEAVQTKYAIRKKILETVQLPVRDARTELRANIIRVMTARAEQRSKRMTPSQHNLFRRG